MKLTTKGRFAVTAMIDLALHMQEGPVTLAGISERQQISQAYLEQLFAKLKRSALIESVRGPGGGYKIVKPLASVNVADIVVAVDETMDATQCGGKGHCGHDHNLPKRNLCMTHDLWTNLNTTMMNYLRSVSLADLVSQEQKKMMPAQQTVVLQGLKQTF